MKSLEEKQGEWCVVEADRSNCFNEGKENLANTLDVLKVKAASSIARWQKMT